MINVGDWVSFNLRIGEAQSRKVRKVEGKVLKIYSRFALLQLKNYRECFWLSDIRKGMRGNGR